MGWNQQPRFERNTHMRDNQPFGRLEFVYQQLHLGRMWCFVKGNVSFNNISDRVSIESVNHLAFDVAKSSRQREKHTLRPSRHLHRTNSQRPVDVEDKNIIWTVSNKKVHCVKRPVKASFGKPGCMWTPKYKQFIMSSGDGKDGKLTFGSSVLAVISKRQRLVMLVIFSYSARGLWENVISFRYFERGPKRLRIGAWNKKDYRFRLRWDTFIIVILYISLFFYIYI